jgi:Tol biopolymer transport system component
VLLALAVLVVSHRADAADITQLTKPNFSPADIAQFGLHRLPATSPHADLVAFSSHSSALVENDTNNLPDIFVWSRASGQVRLLSASANAGANGASFDPALSRDGRFVAFVSSASNLLPDTNKLEDVYLANLATGELELISVRLQNAAARLSATRHTTISEDGRYVAYAAGRADLLPTGTSTRDHVLIRDRVANETIWANSTLETTAVTARPLAIREGRLWFLSATNLYRFDLATRALKGFGRSSAEPAFNSNGSRVATQLLALRTNIVSWYDTATGETNIVYTGDTNRVRTYHSLSIADTGAIAFMAADTNDANRITDIYLATTTGPVTQVSSISTPPGSTVSATAPLLSPDGKTLYFKFTTISKLDGTRRSDLYVRDLVTGSLDIIATGQYFSTMIWTPAGPLVLAGSGDLPFTNPSDTTDLALLPFTSSTPLEVSLTLARAPEGWRISFAKIPNVTPTVQSADVLPPAQWNDLSIPLEDGGSEWLLTDPTISNQRFYRLLVSP